MSDFQAIADRVEIEALWGEFTDAEMMDDYDHFASLFTPDGVWRVPAVSAEFAGREEIRAGIKRLKEDLWKFLNVRAVVPVICSTVGVITSEAGRVSSSSCYPASSAWALV
jgi:uncharacterized protein (TIGR02246 family)